MPYYVYILSNSSDDDLYKGFTENPLQRLAQHNNGNAAFTSTKKQWQFAGVFEFETKKEALVFEKKIKRWNRNSLNNLINSSINKISEFS